MKKIVIFCESYASIAYTLHRLSGKDSNVRAIIYFPSLKNLYRLFDVFNERVFEGELDLIYCPNYVQKRYGRKGITRVLYTVVDIVGERRHLKQLYRKFFESIEGVDVLFPSPGYSGAKIYVIKKLCKKNRVFFIDPGPPYMGPYIPRSIRELGALLIYKMTYGWGVQLGQFPASDSWDKGFPLLADGFMKRSLAGAIDWSRRDQVMENFDWDRFQVFDAHGYQVIYFHQDLVDRDVPDRNTFIRELRSIFDVILRYYPEEKIARKHHPGHEFNTDVIEVGHELPAFIPAEILYDDKVDLYLGISSSAIVSVRGGQAISLMNLISFNSDHLREQQIRWLKKASRTEILFPASMNEFEEIVAIASGEID